MVTDDVPLIDGHCHGVLLSDLDAGGFGWWLTEAGSTTRDPWQSMLGLAVRRWCAPVLDLAAHASPDEYLARRAELGWREASSRLLRAAGVTTWLVDTGFAPPPCSTPAELAALSAAAAAEVVRIESVAEDLAATVSGGDFHASLAERLRARAAGAVALKTVVAYRSGLAVPAQRPPMRDTRAAVDRWLTGGAGRLTDPIVLAWLVHEAAVVCAEAGIALQFHTGLGDADVRLQDADPLLLKDFLAVTRASVVLLHCWPLHRNAFESLLYSSDGRVLPELHYLGAVLWRHHLGRLLDAWIADDVLTTADAERIAHGFGSGNAGRLTSPIAD